MIPRPSARRSGIGTRSAEIGAKGREPDN